jgi:ribonuclease R
MSGERVEGRIIVHPRGFGFVEFDVEDGRESAFIPPPDLLWFLQGDRVAATITEAADGRFSATAIELVSRDRSEVFGAIVSRNGRPHLRVDREISNADWPLVEGVAAPPEGTLVVATLAERAVRPLRTIAPADSSLERVIVRHGIRTTYPDDVLAEARASRSFGAEGRRDLRGIPTITIDAPVSRDLDDALAVIPAAPDGALRLLVSIADVDALVPLGSALDREARLRGTSVYLAGKVIPMLPPELSELGLSLLPDTDRPAMTVEMRIDTDGVIRSIDVYPSLIRSLARLDYDGVAAFLDEGDASAIPEHVRATVRWLRTAAARIAVTRRARGGVSLLREEAYVTMDEATREPTQIGARTNTSAHTLVERLMVAANEAVARWLVDRGLPGVFRVHPAPDARSVDALAKWAHNFGFEAGFGESLTPLGLAAFEAQFVETSIAPAVSNVLGRALGPARYTVHPEMHFGLAAPLYLHFTSPIRRYADLAVHRIVKAFLAGRRDLDARDTTLEAMAASVNELAYRASKAETERVRMLAARLFAGRIGERFRGNVVAVKPFGLVVQLVGLAVTGTIAIEALSGGPFRRDHVRHALVSRERTYNIGDALDVTIASTSEDLGRIDLAPVLA